MVTLQAAFMAMLLSNPGQTVLLDFYSTECGPCRAMQPTIQALETQGYPVQRINITKEPKLAAQYGVQNVPCFVMLAEGKEVDRVIGGTSFSRLEKMYRVAATNLAGSPKEGQGDRSSGFASQGNLAGNRPGSDPASATSSASTFSPSNSQVMPASFQASASSSNTLAAQAGNQSTYPTSETPSATPKASSNPLSDAQLLAASVRIRVKDPTGQSCGSGTIIDSRDGKALILTCGHLFRDSKGQGKIEVDLFGPFAGQKVEGRMETYNADQPDIGLISIQTPGPITAARLAPAGYQVRQGDPVTSVGCDNGADASVRHSKVTTINRYLGTANLQVAGQPVEGRSGGGLFSAEGYVIGVCNACDPSDKEGFYAALEPVCQILDKANLSFVYQDPRGWEKSMNADAGLLAASANNTMPSELARGNAPRTLPNMASSEPLASMPTSFPGSDSGSPNGALSGSPNGTLTGTPTTGLNLGEQAALDEIHRHLKEGSEVVCVIRPRNNPGAKSEVIMLDKASPEFVRQISREGRPTGLPTSFRDDSTPTASSREMASTAFVKDLLPTSLEVAQPRKKILEWSLPESMPSNLNN